MFMLSINTVLTNPAGLKLQNINIANQHRVFDPVDIVSINLCDPELSR